MPELEGGSSAATRTGLTIEVRVLPETPAHGREGARALRLGAQDYLTKPAPSGNEVVRTVDQVVEKKRRLSH